MKCQNCGENEANVRYTQIINGVKKEMALCDECSKALGLQSLDFNIPINFSSFLGEFLGEGNMLNDILPQESLKCEKCGMSYDEFIKKGKFGCENCYTVFSDQINSLLKNLQGIDKHIGKKYKMIEQENNNMPKAEKVEDINEDNKIEKLKQDLKNAIKEERYEDAAKIRDEIKKEENK